MIKHDTLQPLPGPAIACEDAGFGTELATVLLAVMLVAGGFAVFRFCVPLDSVLRQSVGPVQTADTALRQADNFDSFFARRVHFR